MIADASHRAGQPRAALPCPRVLALAIVLALPMAAHAEVSVSAEADPTTLEGLQVTARRQSQADSYTLPASRAAIGLELDLRQTPQH